MANRHSTRPSKVDQALERWQAELLDLTRSNKLLHLQPSASGFVRITYPDAASLYKRATSTSKRMGFYRPDTLDLSRLFEDDEPLATTRPPRPPKSDEVVAHGDAKQVEPLLNRLRLRSRSLLREHGVPALYLAFGILEWRPTIRDEAFRTPLIFVPVRLDRTSAREPHFIERTDEAPLLNPALARKLRLDTGIDLGQLPSDLMSMDYRQAIDAIASLVAHRDHFVVVPDTVALGVFSFSKFTMYADLHQNRAKFASHPVIRAIAGEEVNELGFPQQPPSAREIDQQRHPREQFQILDADSSQLETIELVNLGANLVIQGPPGTGKSQTIANIIAESLARGKSVLFVSEKVAALQVVANRLDKAGFKPFYLDASTQGENRGAIIRDIYECWTDPPEVRRSAEPNDLERLAQQRRRLQQYADALHRRDNPMAMSAYEAISEWSALADLPSIPLEVESPQTLTRSSISEISDLVQHLIGLEHVLRNQESHPWRGYRADRYLDNYDIPGNPSDLPRQLRLLGESALRLQHAIQAVEEDLGVSTSSTLHGAQWLSTVLHLASRIGDVPEHWFKQADFHELRQEAWSTRAVIDELTRIRHRLSERYRPAMLELDLEHIQRTISAAPHIASRIQEAGSPIKRAHSARSQLQPMLQQLLEQVEQAHAIGQPLADLIHDESPITLHSMSTLLDRLEAVVDLAPLSTAMLDDRRRSEIRMWIDEAELHQIRATEFFNGFKSHLAQSAIELPVTELRLRFEQSYASRWSRLGRAYRKDRTILKRHWISFRPLDRESALEALTSLEGYVSEQGWFDAHQATLQSLFGPHYSGPDTDWQAVREFVEDAWRVLSTIKQPLTATLRSHLLGSDNGTLLQKLQHARQVLVEVEQTLNAFSNLVRLDDTPLRTPLEAERDATIAWLTEWRDSLQGLWDTLDQLQGVAVDHDLALNALATDVRDAQKVMRLTEHLTARHEQLANRFGSAYRGVETSWSEIEQAIDETENFMRSYNGIPEDRFVHVVRTQSSTVAQWHTQLDRLLHDVAQPVQIVDKVLDPRFYDGPGGSLQAASLPDLASWALRKRDEVPLLEEWIDLARVGRQLTEFGLTDVLTIVGNTSVASFNWPKCVLRSVWKAWLDWWVSQNPELSTYELRKTETAAERFRSLDVKQWEIQAERIASSIRHRMPDAYGAIIGRSRTTPEGLIAHEARKRQRHIPLRELFAKAGTLVQQVKPCFIMTPLTVAQHLGDADLEFDLVIFDEASQIMPADAVGAIGRGRQVVIVGDRQQLPPTRFFSVGSEITDVDDDYIEVPDSILDACTQYLPTKRLLWHYRSRHEQLIAFSNEHFYEGSLRTFPSPDDAIKAIKLEYVKDGVYDSGGMRINLVEARRVADAVIKYRLAHPDRSLGVVTFSEAQMVAVQHELDNRKRADPSLEATLSEEVNEGFFVKNLENVQGDERDTIFFSVGYGPNRDGKFLHNFGPLNKSGGERRLNVAITRARYEVVVFASFLPDQIDDQRIRSKGARLLKAYLKYAENGHLQRMSRSRLEKAMTTDAIVERIAAALAERGMTVDCELGAGELPIDIAIKDPGSDRYLIAIDCDGPKYHALPTVRERERLRPGVLERLGWKVHQVRALSWYRNPEAEMGRIDELFSIAKSSGIGD